MASDSDTIQPSDDDSKSHTVGSIAESTLRDIEIEFEDARELLLDMSLNRNEVVRLLQLDLLEVGLQHFFQHLDLLYQ